MTNATATQPGSTLAAATPRMWALWSAAAFAVMTAVLQLFVWTAPTIHDLMVGNAAAEARQGLRMMWYGVAAITCTYPLVLLLLRRMPPVVTKPVLGFVALLTGSQALLFTVAALWMDGPQGLLSLPQWALYAAVAALVWLARPPRPAESSAPLARRSRGRLVLFWLTVIFGGFQAILHGVVATSQGWAAELLASNTPPASRPALYVTWLFSCVVFISVPVALVWSLRAPAAAGRFVVRYVAALIGVLMTSWAGTVAFGLGPDMDPAGPVSLAITVVLIALNAPGKK
ncbi:hypothetical protein ACQEVF_53515 [Nonomuraea polychroma]|uniref:hypothetical protein n=1 Tax=Nonomuraea polychroma TaxID=46176 RepID=UPI003D929CD8